MIPAPFPATGVWPVARYSAAPLHACLALAIAPLPAQAQETQSGTTDQAVRTARDYWSVKVEEDDPCAVAQAEAAPDTIVVCEERADSERYMIETRTADDGKSGGGVPRAPDVDGLPPPSGFTARGCIKGINCPPPPAYMIDFDALPDTPAGSPAARWGGPTSMEAPAPPASDDDTAQIPDIGAGLADDLVGP